MPAIIPLAIVAAGVGGAAIAANGAKSAANTQKKAADDAIAAQTNAQGVVQQQEAPYTQTGAQATQALANFYGLPGQSGTGGAPDYNSILQNLPGYQFQSDQGNLAVQRNLAAKGLLQSGAAGKQLQQFGQGLAQTYAGQYTSGLQGLAGMGQAGAAGVAQGALSTAGGVSNALGYAGNAGAQGTLNATNALNFGLSGLTTGLSSYQANRGYGQYGTAGLAPYQPQSQSDPYWNYQGGG